MGSLPIFFIRAGSFFVDNLMQSDELCVYLYVVEMQKYGEKSQGRRVKRSVGVSY